MTNATSARFVNALLDFATIRARYHYAYRTVSYSSVGAYGSWKAARADAARLARKTGEVVLLYGPQQAWQVTPRRARCLWTMIENEEARVMELRVGQVWADNDKRAEGRQIRVEEIGGGYALCSIVSESRETLALRAELHRKARPNRTVKIRLDRFRPTSTGYRFVSGPPAEEEDAV